ncbi:MAG: hypothetical protein QM752_07445 [Gammaproteobacteria bacterium]
MQNLAGNLFMLQTELIDNKVEANVSKAIAPVLEQIMNLRMEMHQEMHALGERISSVEVTLGERISSVEAALGERISAVESTLGMRLSAVEATLGMRNKNRDEIRNRFYDYVFRAGWLALGSLLTYLAIHCQVLFVAH